MKVISIDDFSGGKNNWDLQTAIKDNQCASASVNVLAPIGILTKMPGLNLYRTLTATSTASQITSLYIDENINTTYSEYYRITYPITGTGAVTGLFYPYANGTQALGYTTGTVSVSGASLISATGSGTSWTANVSANDIFSADATQTQWSQVASVEDNTHLTLRSALAAAVATGTSYIIAPALAQNTNGLALVAWASLNGSWWSSTTGDQLQRYDGTGITRFSSAPKAAFLTVHKNYLFAARTDANESRLFWSAIKDPTSWPASNFIDIDVLRGKITGMISYGNELIVFKTRGMYKIIGEVFSPTVPTYSVQPVSVPSYFNHNTSLGMAIHKGQLYFLACGHIYVYRHGTFFITRISRNYERQDLPNSFGPITDTSASEQRICAVSFNDFFILKGLTITTQTRLPAGLLDPNDAWWYVDNSNETQSQTIFGGVVPFGITPASTTNPGLLILASNQYPHVYNWQFTPDFQTYPNYVNTTNASAVGIPATWVSKEFSIEYGNFHKLVVYLYKQTSGTFTLGYSIDQAAFINNTIDMTVGRGNIIRAVIKIAQKGTSIQLKVTQNTTGVTFQILGFKIYYDPIDENYQR